MIVDLDAGHHRLMADAAPRIFVDLCDQRLDRPPPVPDDVGRLALSYRDDPAANHEDAIVTAFVLLLDNDLSAVHRSLFETPPNLLGRAQVEADPPAVVAVQRLDDHGAAQALRGRDGLVGGADQSALRRGDPDLGQQALGQVLVAGGLDGDQRGLAGDAGADALLVRPPAQLDQALVVETHQRDSATA